MGLNKSTPSKWALRVLPYVVLFVVGIGLGAVLGDIPYVTFDKKVDVAACIAVLGFIATVFYIPYVVERKFVKIDHINEVIRADIESIHEDVLHLKQVYVGIKPNAKVSKAKYTQIISLFKTISASILALNKELEGRNRLGGFKKDIYDDIYVPAKEACTDELVITESMDARTIFAAMAELDKLCAKLREYRYKTYSGE